MNTLDKIENDELSDRDNFILKHNIISLIKDNKIITYRL